MDDPAFEMHVGRLFAESPFFADGPLFAQEIESRLGRGWALRRVLIAGAGVAGGLIAVGQLIGSGLVARLNGVSHMIASARQGVVHMPSAIQPQLNIISDLPFGAEVVWLVVGLAVLAGALLAGRTLEEL